MAKVELEATCFTRQPNNSSVCDCYMKDKIYGNECPAQNQGARSPQHLTQADRKMSGIVAPASISPRPTLKSQQSTSLPSTPNQRPRDLISHPRSPSGKRNASNPSPRSHHSDSLPLPPHRPNRGCKYETGMANAKRRVPYSLGPDKLDAAVDVPKASLSTAEDERLSNDMRAMYNQLLPSEESEARRSFL